MIMEDYVSYETAKLLKEKGFDEPCHALYHNGEDKIFFGLDVDSYHNTALNENCYACPTLQMAMKWLREWEQLYIMLGFERPSCIEYKIYKYESEIGRKNLLYYNYEDSYEQACEAAIKYCLENLI